MYMIADAKRGNSHGFLKIVFWIKNIIWKSLILTKVIKTKLPDNTNKKRHNGTTALYDKPNLTVLKSSFY